MNAPLCETEIATRIALRCAEDNPLAKTSNVVFPSALNFHKHYLLQYFPPHFERQKWGGCGEGCINVGRESIPASLFANVLIFTQPPTLSS